MKKEILKLLTARGTLIEPDAMEYILSQKDPVEYAKRLLNSVGERPLILTVEDIKKINSFSETPAKVILPKKEPAEKLAIHVEVSGKSTCTGAIEDFLKYFESRYARIRKMLRLRREMVGVMPVENAKCTEGQIKVIGIVDSAKETKQGHKVLELNDNTGNITALIPNTSPLITETVIQDEVLGVVGKFSRKKTLMIVDEIVRPEFQLSRPVHKSSETVHAMFISDLHMGSKTFLHDAWERLIHWFKTDAELGGKIKYLIICGDVVDGVGIYPNQEGDLEIKDLLKQYETLANKLREIPESVTIILLPGNHDAVRQAEPQPSLPEELRNLFPKNVIFVGNPSYFSLYGVEILAYHGRSMDDFITAIPGMSYTQPIQIMKEMLKRRHLAPVYGSRTPIAPEHEDYLVIEKVPDIFVTGHVHSYAAEMYRNILLINASTWQSQTSYQVMQGIVPVPAKACIVNLQTMDTRAIDFL